MNESRAHQVWAHFLAGEPLSSEDERILLEAFQSDEAFRREALRDARTDGLLRVDATPAEECESLIDSVFERMDAEKDGTGFIKKVDLRIDEDGSRHRDTPRSGEAGAPHRRSTRRSANRGRGAGNRNYLLPALVAAGVLFGAVLLFNLSSWGPSPAEPGKSGAARNAEVAKLERVEGESYVLTPSGKVRARAGMDLLLGQGFETAGSATQAVLVFSDRSRVEVGPDAEIRELKAEGGKRVFVARGEVRAEVAKQAKDQPMVFATAHGEATVLGTTLRIVTSPDPKKGMRLEVEEGKVQLKNLEGSTVLVESGQFAVAAAGEELATRPLRAPGLICHWTFDEGEGPRAADVSGHGNDAVLVGSPTRTRGRLGGALSFNGASTYVDCGTLPNLNFGANAPFTIAGWVKTESSYGPILTLRNGEDYSAAILVGVGIGNNPTDKASGNLAGALRQDRGRRLDMAVVSGGRVNDGKWHAFALTRSAGGVIELFLDGSSQGRSSNVDSAGAITTNLRSIGCDRLYVKWSTGTPEERSWLENHPNTRDHMYFNGSIDDLRVYGRALQEPEIRALANP